MYAVAENEKKILAFLFDNPSKLGLIEKDLLLLDISKTFYDVLCRLNQESVTPDLSHILAEDTEGILTEGIVTNILDTEYQEDKLEYYIQKLKEDYVKSNIRTDLLSNITKMVSSKNKLDLDEFKKLSNKLTDGINFLEKKNSNILIDSEQLFSDYVADLENRVYGTYTYGDFFLDERINGGPAPGTITTMFGPTGGGKSSFVSHLVRHCLNRSVPCVYDSLEMGKIMTMDRIISSITKIPMQDLYPTFTNELPDYVIERVKVKKKLFERFKNFYFIEDPNQKISDIEKIVKEAKKKFKTDWLIFFADLYSMFRDHGNTPQEIEDGMNRLHSLVKKLGIHFVAVVQANRENEGHRPKDPYDTEKFRPTLKNIKNAAAYAERSRVVLATFRPKYYASRWFSGDREFQEDLDAMDDIANLYILKQNQGQVGTIKYLFDSSIFTFTPLVDEGEE
ncbi:MAG: hypothetical protein GF311_28105, partial [Candidatus Lokiarchaeota archaeon]|nr:hypothetical protein [Candidatus Lokiarchaeota archaeon]